MADNIQEQIDYHENIGKIIKKRANNQFATGKQEETYENNKSIS